MHIRPIEHADFAAVAALMRALSLEFVVNNAAPDAAARFVDANDEAAIRSYADAGIVYHVAILDGALAGFVAVRDRSHLYHLFVARALHGRGIAHALWAVARRCAVDGGGDGAFTVNASDHAVPAYEALGFVRSAPRMNVKGLDVNPMRLGSAASLIGAA